jgi:hypothetical protein
MGTAVSLYDVPPERCSPSPSADPQDPRRFSSYNAQRRAAGRLPPPRKECLEGNFQAATLSARLYSMKVDAIRSRTHSFEGVELINSGETCDDEAT